MSRERLLQESFELVVRTMALRPPQVAALRELRDALLHLPGRLSECPAETACEFLEFEEGWKHPYHPTFTLALATGVGKTRLAGAIIAFLWLSNEARTFLILAPRRAVLRRFESALDPRFREYLFVDQSFLPEPHVIRADEIDTPNATDYGRGLFATGPRIYLLSPQLITSSERFTTRTDFSDCSPADVLRRQKDLVVIVDEAHHVGRLPNAETSAWALSIRELRPSLQLGLTATPRNEPGVNLLYEYPLNKALMEGHYTKKVQILVRRFGDEWMPDDVDHATVDFAIQRLAEKKRAVDAWAGNITFPQTKPVAVLFCRDIEHAKNIYDWILTTERLTTEQLLLTHSKMSKSEEEIERLLSIESPDNPVRVVVNVMELTEGWDVTNVYVVAPLRAMATFTGALQAMGRGLRLPAGRRVGNAELDSLDVVCFGKEMLAHIVEQATEWAGHAPSGLGDLRVMEHDAPRPNTVLVPIRAIRNVSLPIRNLEIRHEDINLQLDPAVLRRISSAIVEGLELATARTRVTRVDGRSRLARTRFLQAAASRVIQLMPRHLSDELHFEAIRSVVSQWLDEARPNVEWIDVDPMEVGEELASVLRDEVSRHLAQYKDLGTNNDLFFPDFFLPWDVFDGQQSFSIDALPVFMSTSCFDSGIPYRGWQLSVHEAYTFDVRPEALAARLIDQAPSTRWWLRNQPRRLKIPTPAGSNYHPDFVIEFEADGREILLLEAKSDRFWEPADGKERLNAAAAKEWCSAQSQATGINWSYAVALESDIERHESWVALEPHLIR